MIGPTLPTELQRQPTTDSQIPADEDEDEDDYAPALPPDLVAQRSQPSLMQTATISTNDSKLIHHNEEEDHEDDEDEDVGPMPLPANLNSQEEERDGVAEFLEREKRRKKAIEVLSSH
jgi:hypothetical protein